MPSLHQTPSTQHPALSRYWLILGIIALAIGGLYSLTLVIGRAPGLSDNPEIQRIFKDALVVHVDLSFLTWFMAILCLMLSRASAGVKPFFPYIEEAALICFALTIIFMMIAPFDPNAVALMSNYIPMISSPLFMLALGFLLCSVGLMIVLSASCLVAGNSPSFHAPCTNYQSLFIISLIAIACFIWSYFLMPNVLEGEQYFEILFWGGGHVLQLLYAQMAMMVWLILSGQWAVGSGQKKWLAVLFSITPLAALLSPIAYLLYDITSSEFRNFFTHKMIALGGLAPGILSAYLLYKLWGARSARFGENRALYSTLVCSMLLFLYGGFLGLLIQGQNVVIPAHYHGSTVGITLAFMGFAYYLLPEYGYKKVAHTRLAFWQPIVSTLGQFLHVSGLAYSGGYGVLRKTAGGVGELALNVKIALGVMGMGGLLAIIGGIMFVIVVGRSLLSRSSSGNEHLLPLGEGRR